MTASRHDRLWKSAGWIILLFTASLLAFRIDISSDVLFINDFIDDLLTGGSVQEWKLAPAPQFFPDMLIDFLSYPFFHTITSRLFCVSFTEVLLIFFACRFFIRRLTPELSGRTEAALACVVSLAVLTALSDPENMIFLFNSNSAHFPHLFFSFLALGWLWDFLKKPSCGVAFFIIFASSLGAVSDALFFMSFTAPAIVLVAIQFAATLHWKKKPGPAALPNVLAGAVIMIGAAGAELLKKLLVYSNPLNNRLPMSKEGIFNSINALGKENEHFFDLNMPWNFVFHSLILLAALVLLYIIIKNLRNKATNRDCVVVRTTCFLVLSLYAVLSGAIITGAFDPTGYRYLTFPVCLLLILMIHELSKCSWFYNLPGNLFLNMQFLILLGGGVSLILSPIFDNEGRVTQRRWMQPNWLIQENQIAACITDLRAKGIPLQAGVSDYWHARGVVYALADDTVIASVNYDLSPFDWMTSYHRMWHKETYNNKPYQFIIMRRSSLPIQQPTLDLTPEIMGTYLPAGGTARDCPHSDWQIWKYADDRLDKAVREKERRFLFSKSTHPGKVDFLPASLPSKTGRKDGNFRVATEGDAPGALVHGPYIVLPKGQYGIIIHYKAEGADEKTPIAKWNFGQFSKTNAVLATGEILPAKNGVIIAKVNLPAELDAVETQIFFYGKGTLKITSIDIERY